MRFRSVRSALSVKIMFLHHTLETFSLRAPDHIHEIAGLKLADAEIHFALRQIISQSKLANEFLRPDVRFLEVTELGFAHARFLLRRETNLHGRVPVALVR